MLDNEKMAYHENYLEGWNSYDPETVVAQFAEGGTYVDPNVEEPSEGAEIGEYVVGIMNGFPDFRFEQRRLLMTNEEGVLVEEWTMHRTHSGSLDSLPPTGNRIALDGISIVTISDDGITSIEGYFDQESFAEQLGLTFPAIIGQLPTLAVGALKEAL